MARHWNWANGLTLVGAASATACLLFAMSGRFAYALVALIGAGVCDMFDGVVARRIVRSEEQQRFGAQLDALVDACAFGLAPVAVLYGIGLSSPLALATLFLLPLATVWRLAAFQTASARSHYTGLPATYVALVVPIALLFGFFGPAAAKFAGLACAAFLPVAMLAPIRIPSPKLRTRIGLLVAAIGVTIAFTAYQREYAQAIRGVHVEGP